MVCLYAVESGVCLVECRLKVVVDVDFVVVYSCLYCSALDVSTSGPINGGTEVLYRVYWEGHPRGVSGNGRG